MAMIPPLACGPVGRLLACPVAERLQLQILVLLTFDGIETYTVALLLGDAVPESVRGTVDSTYYTHYPSLSNVEINWGLGSLGRVDMNKTLSDVYSFVANGTGCTNLDVSLADIPLTNITGTIPGRPSRRRRRSRLCCVRPRHQLSTASAPTSSRKARRVARLTRCGVV
ncbi:hypothetical protein EDB89DRAFT_2072383 [Lactarius sanguifluus]|nr:hypothetical protein EDB89DRAFT_2072383 [Lactarius sanguifluus]